MKNYIDLGSCNFGCGRLVIYLDTLEEYLGIGPLEKHEVRLQYQTEMTREGEQYRMVVLKVLSKDMDRFLAAMEDLKTKMLICGHADYETRGAELIAALEEDFRRDMAEHGKAQSPLGGTIRAKRSVRRRNRYADEILY